jgi:hypothetical protein
VRAIFPLSCPQPSADEEDPLGQLERLFLELKGKAAVKAQ